MILVSVGILIASGCARNTLKSYEHAEYGVGNKDNPHYIKAVSDCRSAEYAKGIMIDGTLVKDIELIEKYEEEYTQWMIDEAVKAAYAPGSGAHAGAMSAASVTTGNASIGSNSNTKSKGSMPPMPDKYQDLKRSREARRSCLEDQGWKKPQ